MQTFAHPVPQQTSGRLAMISIVGAVHVVLIYALLVTMGYVQAPIALSPVIVHLIPEHPTTSPPPPSTDPTFVRPTEPTVPPPVLQTDHGDQTQYGGTFADPGPTLVTPAPTAAMALSATHTIPPYPALDRRLDHQGTVRLRLSIDASGQVSDASVERSSGYEGLDTAAIEWVKAHWRYKPATQGGSPVPATSEADVTFKLTQG